MACNTVGEQPAPLDDIGNAVGEQPTPPDKPVVAASSAAVLRKQKSELVNADGTTLDIEELNVPQTLKALLRELDVDASGRITEENLQDSLSVFKHLKAGLDSDGSGQLTHEEMQDGVDLLTRLLKGKRENSTDMEYKHLPQCIQEVMGEWDADGSGKVSASELAAAAKAYQKIQQEGRLMRKIILGLAVVILILMVGIFVLSFAAAEATKEMRGSNDGVMSTPSGEVVKLSSSDFKVAEDGSLIIRGAPQTATCPAGQTCRRLGAATGSGSLKVSQSETGRQLSSTLPDQSFKELKSLTLKDNANHSVKISINNFQRVRLKSSKCGSIINLCSEQGCIILDDYSMSADEVMEGFLEAAGMGNLFEGRRLSGFGRRLSSTDGMLEGFFNLLDDIEWACESVELPSPDAVPQFYHAKIQVKHLHESPSEAYSYLFADADGNALTLAGVVKEEGSGRLFKTWTEELVNVGALTAYQSQYAMTPFVKEVRVKRGDLQVRMEAVDKIGYRCLVEGVEKSAMANAAGDKPPKIEFMGIENSKGMVLRHWRLYTLDVDSESADPELKAMVQGGMVPNVIDYFDVDTDPSEVFEPGQPYKIVMKSTVQGAKVYTEKVYTEIKALPAALEMRGVLEMLNISALDTPCALDEAVQNSASAKLLLDDVGYLTVTNRSIDAETSPAPPPSEPWTELPVNVKFNYDQILQENAADRDSPELNSAKASDYWNSILKYPSNEENLLAALPADFVADSDGNGTQTDGTRRLGMITDMGEDGSYTVEISEDDLEASRVGTVPAEHQPRRLAHDRRLGKKAKWRFTCKISSTQVDLKVTIGKAKMRFIVEYCHLYSPRSSKWAACSSGRHGAGTVVKLTGTGNGKDQLYPWPQVTSTMDGELVYDDSGYSYSPTLYGEITHQYVAKVYSGYGFSTNTRITANSKWHNRYGSYIEQVYGKSTFRSGKLTAWIDVGFYPQEPWFKKYKAWQVCAKVGYELDLMWTSAGGSWQIFCSNLYF